MAAVNPEGGEAREMVVIAFASLKGGVGKTTLTYNLAFLWADRGKRVLALILTLRAT
jgi:cellulose biosynthesis protein BcsQ